MASAATCGPDEGLVATSPIAFVGSVVGVGEAGAVATFTVEEVWGSEALGETVQVSGDTGVWSGSTGGRYLVFASAVGDRLTLFNGAGACRAFFVMDPGWEEFRPASAHPPLTPDTETDVPAQLLLGGGLLAVIGLVSAMAFRRRSSAV
jgi:hypothetical protein